MDLIRRPKGENDAAAGGIEPDEKKLPFPKRIFFIVGNEFCERYSFFGMKSILMLYFTLKLNWSPHTSTDAIHAFILCYYTAPIFGSFIADNYLGKYKTIIILSTVYIFGHIFKTIAPIPAVHPAAVPLTILGLLLVALGAGGVKPCTAAFGGDQFKSPEQDGQVKTFFSIFYVSVNIGAMISMFVTPTLRKDVHCFGECTCYSAAFGVPAALMAVAIVIIICGQPFYTIKKPEGNQLIPAMKCIAYGIKQRLTSKTEVAHWMDRARDRYSRELVDDVKGLLNILFIFVPIPLYWTLFDQQGSTWTYQAIHMNGEIGSYAIKPDQMQTVNPVLIFILVPLFDIVLFGFLSRPLQRMTLGGSLAACSFVIAGFLELQVMKSHARLPSESNSQLHVMNAFECPIQIWVSRTNSSDLRLNDSSVNSNDNHIFYDLQPGDYSITAQAYPSPNCSHSVPKTLDIHLNNSKVHALVFTPNNELLDLGELENAEKNGDGDTKFIFYVLPSAIPFGSSNFSLKLPGGCGEDEVHQKDTLDEGVLASDYVNLTTGNWNLTLNDSYLGQLHSHPGGVHSVIIFGNDTDNYSVFTLTSTNSVHMLWQVPQYVVLTLGETLFAVTGLRFSFSQAPESMKSVAQGFWLFNAAIGNALMIIINTIANFGAADQYKAFFMFSGLLFGDMIVFAVMAYFYRYREDTHGKKKDSETTDQAEWTDRPKETDAVMDNPGLRNVNKGNEQTTTF